MIIICISDSENPAKLHFVIVDTKAKDGNFNLNPYGSLYNK